MGCRGALIAMRPLWPAAGESRRGWCRSASFHDGRPCRRRSSRLECRRGADMNPMHIDENDASRARVRDFVAGLSDDEMARPVGAHWTVAVGLMHLAFWDRQWQAKLEEWE